MKAIILLGGKATRLPISAKYIPKALVEVGGKPVLQHQIDQLHKYGFFDIRLALGYRADQIIDWLRQCQLSLDYAIEPEPLGTGGAIKFAAKDIDEPFMVLNGDILSDINFKNFYDRFKKGPEENTMTVHYTPDARTYGIVKKRRGRLVEFLEKPADTTSGYINAGFYILRPRVFQKVRAKKFSIEKDIFPQLASRGKLGYYIHKGFWTDAGTEERLADVRKLLN